MSALAEGWADQQVDTRRRRMVGWLASSEKSDLIVILLIVVFGVSAILLRQRTPDFLGEDAFYADAAQSLLHHGFYGVNGIPETTQPPGLAGILAALFAVFGYSYAVSVVAMAVFETLGFIVAYELLRRRSPRLVAATICIILLSSPVYFAWATRMVYACFPYFFTTMIALLSGEEYDQAATARSRIAWGAVMTAAVAASLLIATGTIALLGAMVAVVALTAFKDRRLARTRLLKFLPVLLVGIAVQGLWMHRKPAPLEWTLNGYPASYLNQVKLKNGNYPELGMAKLSDIPARVGTNLLVESDILAQLVLRHGVNPTKLAVVTLPVLFIAIGWVYSVWKTGGMELVDWYFAGYQFVYLLWPWRMEARFFLPIAPLACFYIWRGINAVVLATKSKPRTVGIIWLPLAIFMTVSGAGWIYEHRVTGYGDAPDELLIPVWLISAVYALWMAFKGRSPFSLEPSTTTGSWLERPLGASRVSPLQLVRYTGCLIIIGLVAVGVVIDKRIARENFNITDLADAEGTSVSEIMALEVEAGLWLRSNIPPESIVMARHWPTVRHYAERKLVWFAPISDPEVLLEGIAKHRVNYVVVINHSPPYYLPGDDYCFDRLLAAHGEDFSLVLQEANLRIFRVVRSAGAEPSRPKS